MAGNYYLVCADRLCHGCLACAGAAGSTCLLMSGRLGRLLREVSKTPLCGMFRRADELAAPGTRTRASRQHAFRSWASATTVNRSTGDSLSLPCSAACLLCTCMSVMS
jgi:hypothetical protein